MKFIIDIDDKGHVIKDKKEKLLIKRKKNVVDNSKIDYSIFNQFDFVPKLLKGDRTKLVYELINEEIPFNLEDQSLKLIANNFKKLHNSRVKLVPFDLNQKLKTYRQKIKNKKLSINVLEKYFKRANKILRNLKKTTPIHNDIWPSNIILEKNKAWFVDWELATMGDKHYDLAFFIESSGLNDEQETRFLEFYNDEYTYEYIVQCRILVNYMTIAWLNALEKKRFDDQSLIKRINQLIILYENKFIKKT